VQTPGRNPAGPAHRPAPSHTRLQWTRHAYSVHNNHDRCPLHSSEMIASHRSPLDYGH
jgi:hypothetical protein